MTKTYTIQEAAELTDVSPHTLRFYERIGLLSNIGRAKNGHRRYTDTDIGRVHFVMLLRATGMPLPQIATFMKLEKDGQSTIDKRLRLLAEHRKDLLEHIATLQNHVTALDDKIDYYENTSSDTCDCVQPEETETHAISSTGTNGHQSQPFMFRVNDLR